VNEILEEKEEEVPVNRNEENRDYYVRPTKFVMPHDVAMFYLGPNGKVFEEEFSKFGRVVPPIGKDEEE
jgi:hypothetical protein